MNKFLTFLSILKIVVVAQLVSQKRMRVYSVKAPGRLGD